MGNLYAALDFYFIKGMVSLDYLLILRYKKETPYLRSNGILYHETGIIAAIE